MVLWRCHNCLNPKKGIPGLDFSTDLTTGIVCPECGLKADTPEGRGMIIKLEIIHFDPPHEVLKHKGKNHIACNPKKRVGESSRLWATADHGSVTCEPCRATEAFQKTLPEEERVVTQDVLVTVNDKGIVQHEPLDEFQEAGCCGPVPTK